MIENRHIDLKIWPQISKISYRITFVIYQRSILFVQFRFRYQVPMIQFILEIIVSNFKVMALVYNIKFSRTIFGIKVR